MYRPVAKQSLASIVRIIIGYPPWVIWFTFCPSQECPRQSIDWAPHDFVMILLRIVTLVLKALQHTHLPSDVHRSFTVDFKHINTNHKGPALNGIVVKFCRLKLLLYFWAV